MFVNNGNDYIPDDIWEYIQANRGRELTIETMKKELGRTQSVLHKHLGKLVRSGMLIRRAGCCGVGGVKRYIFLLPDGEEQHE